MMKKFTKLNVYTKYKILIISGISFFFGFMIAINLYPIEKTCRIKNSDKEYNIMNNGKLSSPDLIILIVSAPKNLDRRETIRQTWLTLQLRNHNFNDDKKMKFKHYFVIGSVGLGVDDVMSLSTEQSKYSDILILPMLDSYQNLTFKVLQMFIWLNDQIEVGYDFKYVLKCDDDSFVRLDSLEQELKHLEIIYFKSELDINKLEENESPYMKINAQVNNPYVPVNQLQLYWGYFNGNAKIKINGKWKQSNFVLCDHYLPYAQGGGYIISKNLVKYIAGNAENLRIYNSEDVSVGTWLSTVNNVLRIHDTRFDTEWKSRGCQNYFIITHNHTMHAIRKMHKNIKQSGNLCIKEENLRGKYLYNWNAAPSKCCKLMT